MVEFLFVLAYLACGLLAMRTAHCILRQHKADRPESFRFGGAVLLWPLFAVVLSVAFVLYVLGRLAGGRK